ncbi:MAG TPA: hypothetical protein VGC04_06295 [Cellulomonas sp.]
MWVLTVDQRDSRLVGDRVADLIAGMPVVAGVVRPAERTVGDELQLVLDQGRETVDLALHLLRVGGWSIGIGAGPVDEPLPASAREASGQAFILAREAVEAAKGRHRSVPLAVRGADPAAASDAEAVLALIGVTMARRTPAGWQVADLAAAGEGQAAVARRLGITVQAVSQRLRTALWAEEVAARPAAARLLTAAAG